jgi:4,5-dihydroxyphthalate decarboxylase
VRKLKAAIGNYGITRALKDGSVKPNGFEIEYIEVDPIIQAMRRMVRTLEFDISEMAFTTYLSARAAGIPVTAIPVFLTRNFHHWAMFYNLKSGIQGPKDLEGRVVAVNRGYTVTTGLWARGLLRSEYGVNLDKVTWAPTDDEHVAQFKSPANVDYRFQGREAPELLVEGFVDAAVGDIRIDSPDVKPLIANARAAGFDYYRRTGVYPINHSVVIQDSVLAEDPGVAEQLFYAFKAAKAPYISSLGKTGSQSAADALAVELGSVVGDPFPYGVEENRKALETMVGFAVDQHILPKKMSLEELFAPNTLKLA